MTQPGYAWVVTENGVVTIGGIVHGVAQHTIRYSHIPQEGLTRENILKFPATTEYNKDIPALYGAKCAYYGQQMYCFGGYQLDSEDKPTDVATNQFIQIQLNPKEFRCSPGTFINNDTQGQCQPCPGGTHTSHYGAAAPLPCRNGSQALYGGTSFQSCIPSPANFVYYPDGTNVSCLDLSDESNKTFFCPVGAASENNRRRTPFLKVDSSV